MAKKKPVTISDILVYKFYTGMGHIFKFFFKVFSSGKLSAEREVSDLNLLLFSGVKGGTMLKAVLLSVYNTWERVPHVTICTDGTPREYFEKLMAFWPFPYTLKTWAEQAEHFRAKGAVNLAEFAECNVYAKKLVSVLAEAESRPTVYCDTDVLWFGEPRLPARNAPGSFSFRMSTDNVHCYYLPLIRYFKQQYLLEKPPYNAGLMYMSGSVLDHYPGFDEYMALFKLFEEEAFPEQNAFAMIADKLGDRWSLDEIILTVKDVHWPIIPRYLFSGTQFARHHVVTKKSWFWRDALFILLFKKPTVRKRAAVSSAI
jgi:hypothetical protein